MKSKRAFIDYSLDKRATLLALFRGVVDACDADPYLIRAAKYHGEKTARKCPVCKKDSLVELRYTFGDQLGQFSGRIKNYSRWRKNSENLLSISSKSAAIAPGTTCALLTYWVMDLRESHPVECAPWKMMIGLKGNL